MHADHPLIANTYQVEQALFNTPLESAWRARDTEGQPVLLLSPSKALLENPQARPQLDQQLSPSAHRTGLQRKALVHHDEQPYLVFSDAQSLAEQQPTERNEEALNNLIEDLAKQLDELHNNGHTHNNLSLHTVLISPEPQLLDSQLPSLLFQSPELLAQGLLPGDPRLLAPEILEHKNTPASDQYALASLAWYLHFGQWPFQGPSGTALLLHKTQNDPKAPPQGASKVPKHTTQALRKALSRNPARRFASCRDFARALRTSPAKSHTLSFVALTALLLGLALLYALFGASPPNNAMTFITEETYRCAGRQYTLKVYRSERFAQALGVPPDQRNPACEFVLIPKGQFIMGSTNGRMDERPTRLVTITKPFLLARTEVTQQVWRHIVGTDPSAHKGDDHPVEQVSFYDVELFCKRAKMRLPTEAEWEYAARASTAPIASHTYFWSTKPGDKRIDDSYLWYNKLCFKVPEAQRGHRSVHEHARAKKWNAFGLIDTLGNVFEWCQDDYFRSYKDAPKDQQPRILKATRNFIPKHHHVIRGGAWSYDPRNCRSAFRDAGARAYRASILGFRPARDFTPKDADPQKK